MRRTNKKAQSALEYLMTYGWVLVIIAIVAVALYSMGVLNPATYSKKSCTGFSQLTYKNHKYTGTAFDLVLMNGAGEEITVTAATFGDASATSNSTIIAAGATDTISGTGGTAGTTGASYSVAATVTYDTADLSGLKDSATCTGTYD